MQHKNIKLKQVPTNYPQKHQDTHKTNRNRLKQREKKLINTHRQAKIGKQKQITTNRCQKQTKAMR